MAGQRIHFELPLSLQRFPKFAKLPWDVRRIIWEMAIYTPGMHFLKFEKNLSFDDENRETSKGPSTQFSSHLRPAYNSSRGDRSWYVYRNKYLESLAESCNEAHHLVTNARNNAGNLRLDDTPHDNGTSPQSIVSLAAADDIVCMDYPNMGQAGSHLGDWARCLDRQQLSNIKNVAVRYHITWGEDTRTCHSCGRVHDSRRRIPKMPPHLHQFPELFPNLENFYLIDSFAVLRTTRAEDGFKKKGDRFAFGEGRCCFEIDAGSAVLNHNARNTLNWIREGYNFMAQKKRDGAHAGATNGGGSASSLCKSRSVEFKILASGWDMSQDTAPEPASTLQSRRNLATNKRQPRQRTIERRRRIEHRNRARGPNLNHISSSEITQGRQINTRRDSTASTTSNISAMSSATDSSTVSTASTATSVGDCSTDLPGTMDRLTLHGIKGLHEHGYRLGSCSFTFGDNEVFVDALKTHGVLVLRF